MQRRAEMLMKAEDKYEAAMVDVTEAYLDESDAPEDSKDEALAQKNLRRLLQLALLRYRPPR